MFTSDAVSKLASSALAYLELPHPTERFTDEHFECLLAAGHIGLTASEDSHIINDIIGSVGRFTLFFRRLLKIRVRIPEGVMFP